MERDGITLPASSTASLAPPEAVQQEAVRAHGGAAAGEPGRSPAFSLPWCGSGAVRGAGPRRAGCSPLPLPGLQFCTWYPSCNCSPPPCSPPLLPVSNEVYHNVNYLKLASTSSKHFAPGDQALQPLPSAAAAAPPGSLHASCPAAARTANPPSNPPGLCSGGGGTGAAPAGGSPRCPRELSSAPGPPRGRPQGRAEMLYIFYRLLQTLFF